ncbi:MAG: CRISPR system precrRNA processing endoribonuclease RAMP protein Cas6 [Calditrichaeota bacterium]|nr:CRISPR system precrRNA processing endoribonuclease RAMP protein Cas6 [Calditrichota bacterium]
MHGVLGMALKRRVCVKSDGICDNCFILYRCPYARLILSPKPPDAERMRKYPSVPSPMRLLVEPWDEAVSEKGKEIEATLTFVGRSVEDWAPVLLSLEVAIEQGIGRRSGDGTRGYVKILWVEDVVTGVRRHWNEIDFSRQEEFNLHNWLDLSDGGSPTTLTFHTPARIVFDGKVQTHPTLRNLVASLFRRISSLAYFHCGVTIEEDFKGILDQLVWGGESGNLDRMRAARYSSRQKRKIQMDGMVGSLSLEGITPTALPWIRLGVYTGAGKGVTMGYGGYTVSYE